MHNSIEVCKARLPLPELLVRLGLFERPPQKGNHPCPLHQETKGSAFGMHPKNDGWVWICHGKCSTGGDELSLLQHYKGLSIKDAIRDYEALAGISNHTDFAMPQDRRPVPQPEPTSTPGQEEKKLCLPTDLHNGSREELATVARLRCVPVYSVETMQANGLLKFGTHRRYRSWIMCNDQDKDPKTTRFQPKITHSSHNREFPYSRLPDPLNVHLQGFPPRKQWCTRRGSNP